jgi:hypothetical protein
VPAVPGALGPPGAIGPDVLPLTDGLAEPGALPLADGGAVEPDMVPLEVPGPAVCAWPPGITVVPGGQFGLPLGCEPWRVLGEPGLGFCARRAGASPIASTSTIRIIMMRCIAVSSSRPTVARDVRAFCLPVLGVCKRDSRPDRGVLGPPEPCWSLNVI